MGGILKVTPEQLTSAAAELNACRTTIGNIITSMSDIVHSISPAAFTGEIARAYIDNFDGLQCDITQTYRNVEMLIENIYTMTRKFEDLKDCDVRYKALSFHEID